MPGLNLRPSGYEPAALTAELIHRIRSAVSLPRSVLTYDSVLRTSQGFELLPDFLYDLPQVRRDFGFRFHAAVGLLVVPRRGRNVVERGSGFGGGHRGERFVHFSCVYFEVLGRLHSELLVGVGLVFGFEDDFHLLSDPDFLEFVVHVVLSNSYAAFRPFAFRFSVHGHVTEKVYHLVLESRNGTFLELGFQKGSYDAVSDLFELEERTSFYLFEFFAFRLCAGGHV